MSNMSAGFTADTSEAAVKRNVGVGGNAATPPKPTTPSDSADSTKPSNESVAKSRVGA